jgi:formylglycine-generating enzyme required for sulfatase activity
MAMKNELILRYYYSLMVDALLLRQFVVSLKCTYEVTVGQFRQFVNAGMGTAASPPPTGPGARTLNGMANQGGWDPTWNVSLAVNTMAFITVLNCSAQHQSWTVTPGANEALPMNCVTWFEAMAFCAWDGGFLPTEAEWNYAAAGGSDQRAYPWSSPASDLTIDCAHSNYYDGTAYCVNPPNGAVNRVGNESPAGDGKFGQADLAGNVWEWTLDWYASPYANPCTDCANLTPAPQRVARGGNFNNDASLHRGANRLAAMPDTRNFGIGLRCGRTP